MDRIEAEDPKYIIKYEPTDITSLKDSLEAYVQLIESGEAFQNNYCVAHFEPFNAVVLPFFEDQPLVYDFIFRRVFRDYQKEQTLHGQVLTETLFFACALRFPEMKEDLRLAGERIVAYARMLNDSSEMWLTYEEPFAIEALTLLACVYPEYGYLIAGFLVPYWDDEHMPESLYVLADWARKKGINRDTIKAYAYCDNTAARACVLGYDTYNNIDNAAELGLNFLAHFRNNADDYQYFKEELAKRFQKQPYVQYSNDRDNHVLNPVEVLFLELMRPVYPYDIYSDDFDKDDYLTQTFVTDSAEAEIEQVNKFIEEHLGTSIVILASQHKRSLSKPQKQPEKHSNPFHNWETFVTQELGSDVWRYVTHGLYETELNKINAKPVYSTSRNHSHELYHELAEEVWSEEDFKDNQEDILRPLFKRFLKWDAEGEYKKDGFLLRFLDVLFRLNGYEPFSEEVEELADDLELCSIDDFRKRYSAHWFTELSKSLKQMGSYVDYASREKLHNCYKIINENREEAIDKISDLFNKKSLRSEAGEIRTGKGYGAAELLAFAAYMLWVDKHEEQGDALTDAAEEYLNELLVDKLLLDLYGETNFPKDYLVKQIMGEGEIHLSDAEILRYREEYAEWLRFTKYINDGYIEKDGQRLNSKHSKAEALQILEFFLEYEDEDLSPQQKQIHWLRNFSEETQKLLYAAFVVAQNGNLTASDAAQRLLQLTFALAPVKTAHLLSKSFKKDLYELDSLPRMASMLESFKETGLSEQAYWAYLLSEYGQWRDREEQSYYKVLLQEWSADAHEVSEAGFLRPMHLRQQKALEEGFYLLSNEQQINVLNDANAYFKERSFSKVYNKYLLQLFDRELKERAAVVQAENYFYRRLKGEGYAVEFVEWDKWKHYPEYADEVLNHIQVEKPEKLADEKHAEQLWERKTWSYIVLKKQGKHLVPVWGEDTLWLLQQGFDAESISQAHVKAVIIDDTCPQEYIDELKDYASRSFAYIIRSMVKAYLQNHCSFEEAERFFRYGIDSYFFLDIRTYFDYSYTDILLKVEPTLMKNAFCMLGAIDGKYLKNEYDHKDEAHLNLLMSFGVDNRAIFQMLLQKNDYRFISRLARQINIQDYVLESKIAQQLNLLSCMAHLSRYYPFILSLRNSKSAKLSKHVEMLATKYKMEETREPAYHIVDFGVYQMGGQAGISDDGKRKVVNEPVCTNQTQHIKGEVGMYFGFRFTTSTPDLSPKVLDHQVIVVHPVRHSVTGELISKESSWKQNGYSESNIFLGWYFENEETLLPGTYQMLVCDMGVVLAEKSFVIY